MSNIYEFTGRVLYNKFVEAARQTILTVGANATGRTYNISVNIHGGETASVMMSGSAFIVSLPTIDPDTKITADLATRLMAFLVHETLHVLISERLMRNMGNIPVTISRATGQTREDCRAMLNVIEDIYIERVGCDPKRPVIANAGAILGALNDEFYSGGGYSGAPLKDASLYLLRNINYHGHQITPALSAISHTCDKAIKAACDAALGQIERLAAKHEYNDYVFCVDRVEGITGIVQTLMAAISAIQQQQQQQQQDQQQDQQDQQDQQQDQQDQQSGQQDAQQDQQSGQQSGQQDAQQDAQQDGKLQDQQGQQQDQQGQQAGQNQGQQSGQKDAVVDPDARRNGAVEGVPKITASERSQIMQTPNQALPQGSAPKNHRHMRSQVAAAMKHIDVRQLADAARRSLVHVEQRTITRRLTTGRLDRRAISRMATGALDVMSRKHTTKGVKTSVLVIVDRSGSMVANTRLGLLQTSNIAAAVATSLAVVAACERAGAKVALASFASAEGMLLHKPFEGRLSEQQSKDASHTDARGGTPMGEAVVWAHNALAGIKTDRKIVVWLVDGQPDSTEGTRLAIAKGPRYGVEHVGIGIDCDIRRLFAAGKAARVNDGAALPKAFQQVLGIK